VGVEELNMILGVFKGFIELSFVSTGISEDTSEDGEEVAIDSSCGIINPLVYLCTFEIVGTEEVTLTLSSEETGDSTTFEENSVLGLEEGELSSEHLGLGFLRFSFFFIKNNLFNLNFSESGNDKCGVDE
jgi:hypothetical protein